MGVTHLQFSKDFKIIPQNIVILKLRKSQLDECQVENGLTEDGLQVENHTSPEGAITRLHVEP